MRGPVPQGCTLIGQSVTSPSSPSSFLSPFSIPTERKWPGSPAWNLRVVPDIFWFLELALKSHSTFHLLTWALGTIRHRRLFRVLRQSGWWEESWSLDCPAVEPGLSSCGGWGGGQK